MKTYKIKNTKIMVQAESVGHALSLFNQLGYYPSYSSIVVVKYRQDFAATYFTYVKDRK